jgi:Mg2+ and Co2+ transporter CorA
MTESPQAIRIFHLQPGTPMREQHALPDAPPAQGFYWIVCTRDAFNIALARVQASLQAVSGQQLVEPHVADFLAAQLPSHYDYTSQYDQLVVNRLSAAPPQSGDAPGGQPVLPRIDTIPVGFALFNRVLLTVHSADCSMRDAYIARLTAPVEPVPRGSPMPSARLPVSPADLMLRVIGVIVDKFLDLRRELSRQLDYWQTELLKPRSRFNRWNALLDARLTLHQLDDTCEDQRAAIQAWTETLDTWADSGANASELDLLKVHSRDLLEHIERVVRHVRRLEQSTEAALQMHFSMENSRTNDIMRTLTALTAVFLPLNLITGIFGMNFEFLPAVVKREEGFWLVMAGMTVIGIALTVLFWRKRYLARAANEA